MSHGDILKNIYTFIDILQKACTCGCKDWTRHTLQDSFQWAAYCEKIYEQAEGKPYREDLNKELQKFDSLPWRLCGLTVDLELLKDARATLRKLLLQNPHLSTDQYKAVLSSYGHISSASTELTQDLYSLSNNKACLEAMNLLQMAVFGQQTYNPTSVQATLLLKHIEKVLQSGERSGNLLKEQLRTDIGNEETLEVLLRCLDMAYTENSREFILDGIVTLPQDTHSFLRNIPGDLVLSLSVKHPAIYDLYTHNLLEEARQFEYDYKSIIPNQWRSPRMEYKDILSRFEALHGSKELTDKTVQLISNKTLGREICIYNALLKDVRYKVS